MRQSAFAAGAPPQALLGELTARELIALPQTPYPYLEGGYGEGGIMERASNERERKGKERKGREREKSEWNLGVILGGKWREGMERARDGKGVKFERERKGKGKGGVL